jgi:hypothetical protein
MSNQGLARNSHIVPRFLIARFGDARGQVLVFDKQTDKEERRNPRLLIERDFYLIDTGKGPSDVIEKHMDQKDRGACRDRDAARRRRQVAALIAATRYESTTAGRARRRDTNQRFA